MSNIGCKSPRPSRTHLQHILHASARSDTRGHICNTWCFPSATLLRPENGIMARYIQTLCRTRPASTRPMSDSACRREGTGRARRSYTASGVCALHQPVFTCVARICSAQRSHLNTVHFVVACYKCSPFVTLCPRQHSENVELYRVKYRAKPQHQGWSGLSNVKLPSAALKPRPLSSI